MTGRYTKSGRLSDVLALIQVLALDEYTHRHPSGLEDELQGKPSSADSWTVVAKEHPEFFRLVVRPGKENQVSLVARHVLPHGEGERRPPLSPDFTAALLQTAITLHEREVDASQWLWKTLLPFAAALLSALIGATAAIVAPHFVKLPCQK